MPGLSNVKWPVPPRRLSPAPEKPEMTAVGKIFPSTILKKKEAEFFQPPLGYAVYGVRGTAGFHRQLPQREFPKPLCPVLSGILQGFGTLRNGAFPGRPRKK
jgi:hypothetical protein